jgi:hypothetical protein
VREFLTPEPIGSFLVLANRSASHASQKGPTVRRTPKLFYLVFFAVLAATTAYPQSNPVPFLNVPLAPPSVGPGGPDLTLTLNGGGFVPGSIVRWNCNALSTTYISGWQLNATVPGSDTASASTASVTVSNPTPSGGTSNVVFFPVHAPVTQVTFTNFPQVSGDFSSGSKVINHSVSFALTVK